MELKFTECQAKKRQKAQRLWVISIGIASTLLLAGGLAFFLLGDFGRDDGLDDLPFESTVPAIRQEVTISGVKQVLAVYEASAADESMTADEAKGIQKVVSVLSELHDHRVILDAELEISMEIDPLLQIKRIKPTRIPLTDKTRIFRGGSATSGHSHKRILINLLDG